MASCAFSSVGCLATDCREELNVAQHLRLLLTAVVDVKQRLERLEGQSPPEALAPAERRVESPLAALGLATEKEEVSRQSSERLGQLMPDFEEEPLLIHVVATTATATTAATTTTATATTTTTTATTTASQRLYVYINEDMGCFSSISSLFAGAA